MLPQKLLLAATLLVSAAHGAEAGDATGLCQPEEDVLFTCPIGEKTVSVCSSKDLSPTAGYIQYRFGRKAALELVYPPVKTRPHGYFQFEYDHSGKWAKSQLRFTVNGYAYLVHEYGNSGLQEEESGLVVTDPAGKRTDLSCSDHTFRTGLQSIESSMLPGIPPNQKH